MVIICPKSRSYSLTCAINMAATASYRAVPSMLMVAPTGRTNRAIRLSIPLFSRRHFRVMGSVAELLREKIHSLKISLSRCVHNKRNAITKKYNPR